MNNETNELNLILSEKIINRFWSNVRKQEDGCWEWQKSCNHKNGYGQFRVGSKIHTAHKIAMTIIHKQFPKLFLLHSCHNPKCVNPSHLREGSHNENMIEMYEAGRSHIQKTKIESEFSNFVKKLNLSEKKLLYTILHNELYENNYEESHP